MRITVDLDNVTEKKVRQIFRRCCKLINKTPEIYKTRKGYHLIVSGLPISFKQSLLLRRKLGDDFQRILFDIECNSKPRQILWNEKRYENKVFKVQPIKYGDLRCQK
jgi:hypothetical protein